jgi:ABC-type thiamine transport system ATPase subunit
MNQDSQWRVVAEKLAAALQGTTKRHRIALAHVLGEDEPIFDPPAPSIGDNLRNVSDAMSAFDKMKIMAAMPNESSSPTGAEKEQSNEKR